MRDAPLPSITGLLLSGGIDSAVLLSDLLERGWQVVPFYVRTGCAWQAEELSAVRHFVQLLARPSLFDLVELEMPLADVYGRHWSMTGSHVPDDQSPDEAVFLPGRNPLLLMKPALWCHTHGIPQLALATLAGNPFRDATPEFFARFEAMLHAALDGQVRISRPFEHLTKSRVLELGHGLPLEWTFSCLAPVAGLHCGSCNKCAERQRGFREIGFEDRTRYVDRAKIASPNGPASGPAAS
jgi:7-cyano-7-deazaguanine synthase